MDNRRVIGIGEPSANLSECYRMLRNDIQFSEEGSNVKSVLITSTKEGEGKTTTAANLALSMARSGQKTLLIDCNLNNPSINTLFDIRNNIGLTTLFKQGNFNERAVIKSKFDNLYILPSGLECDNSLDIFSSKEMQDIFRTVRNRYDFIVIDTPAITQVCDAQIISQYVDGCILVVGAGEVDLEEVKKAQEILHRVNAKILGAVLTKATREEKSRKHTRRQKIKDKKIFEHRNSSKNYVGGYATNNGGEKVKRKIALNILLIAFIMIMGTQNSLVMAQGFKVSKQQYTVAEEDYIKKIDMEESEEKEEDEKLPPIQELLQQNEEFRFYELPEEDSNGNNVDEEYIKQYYENMEKKRQQEMKSNKINSLQRKSIPQKSLLQKSSTKSNYEISNSPKYPLVLKQKKPHLFTYYTVDSNSSLKASVIGDNGYIVELAKIPINFIHLWIYKPKTSGIYKFIIRDGNKVVYEKKIYINSSNNKYLQIEDIKVNNNTKIGAKLVENGREGKKNSINNYNLNKTEMKFVVSEPNIWTKTLKKHISDYEKDEKDKKDKKEYYTADASELKSDERNSNEQFYFGKGNYKVGAFIKKDISIEWEDAKFENYCNESHISKLNLNYTKGDNNTFHFVAKVDSNEQFENLIYAFLLYDENGTKVIKSYSKSNECDITFSAPGTYYVSARVKHNDYSFNSYEAQSSQKIVIEGKNRCNVSIKKVEIKKYINFALKKPIELNENKTPNIESHESYIISISPQGNSSGIEYKAYAVHDGYCYALSEYSECNEIPFYPKSYGKYKIIVLAKHSDSGSEDARREFTINVK